MFLTKKDISKFWNYVDVRGPDECWLWLGGKHKDGHGVYNTAEGTLIAHRVSFFIENGYVPDYSDGKVVMHDCEIHACQNPKHLIDGSVKENNNYEGFLAAHRGEKNASSKLTEDIVRSILRSKRRNFELAKEYHVSQFTISAIKRRVRWKHVEA